MWDRLPSVAVDEDGSEHIFEMFPERTEYGTWDMNAVASYIHLPPGTIKKLIGRELSWQDEPVVLK